MDRIVLRYLKKFKKSTLIDINEHMMLTILLRNNLKKNIQLDGNWRLFLKSKLVLSKADLSHVKDLKKWIHQLTLKKVIINEKNDLIIQFENDLELQVLVDRNRYENWEINQEVICLPGGVLTHFLK